MTKTDAYQLTSDLYSVPISGDPVLDKVLYRLPQCFNRRDFMNRCSELGIAYDTASQLIEAATSSGIVRINKNQMEKL